jgi:TRAP-type C4-dicarboxylate transport system permease small subunit
MLINGLVKFYKALLKIETGLLIALLLSMILMAVVQIVMRNLFDSGLFWAESYIRTCVLWVALIGAMVGSRNGEHVAIDFFIHKSSNAMRQIIQRVTDLFSAVLCSLMTYHSSVFVYSEYQDGGLAFGMIPNWASESIIPITFAVISCRYLVAALFNLRELPENA